jgi:plasmid segregation protein ParM
MSTDNFKTKTSFFDRENGTAGDKFLIALDIGYSAVKLFSENKIARFPSYARRVDKDFALLTEAPESMILYKNNETGEMWCVGETAQDLISVTDTSDSDAALYGRERYGNPMFNVIAEVGLGIGMMSNKYGSSEGKELVVQTGLPEKYLKMDKDILVDILAGKHNFQIKIGTNPWKAFDFYLDSNQIYVMSQPKGTLFSIAITKDATWHPDAKKYLKSSLLVFDAGFGTLDLFPIKSSVIGQGETFADLGMKRVLQATSQSIMEQYKQEVPVSAMQKYLKTGKVRVIDRRRFTSKDVDFADMLYKANTEICNEAVDRMTNVIDIADYDYLVITGGTGAAWENTIKDRLKGLETLTILNGNQNDDLPMVYSNVRGYFMYRLLNLKR